VGGKRQRALLALLLLRASEAVSSDLLIDEFFGGNAGETAMNGLQVAVSRLRRVLEEGETDRVLLTRPPGYALQVAREQVDLTRFERMLEDGRKALSARDPARAAAVLRDALALWRGEPLADLGGHEFAERERRLEELRLDAVMERIDADLALRRGSGLVAELETLVSEHPFAERLRGQLMLALYRAGRQAEALAAYREARRVLVEELGIEPSQELRELEQAILRQDSSLAHVATPEVGAEPDDSAGVFVGRERELEALRSGLDSVLVGHGRCSFWSASPESGRAGSRRMLRAKRRRAVRTSSSAARGRPAALPPTGRGCSRYER
jgi:DNA-binding SARP family transcriptional activator